MSFGKYTSDNQVATENLDPTLNKRVTVSQVITDSELVEKSQHLESALQTGHLHEYCNYKIESASNETQSSIWRFIQATFSSNKNETFLELLGFTSENLSQNINNLLMKSNEEETNDSIKTNGSALSENLNGLNLNGGTNNFFEQTSFKSSNDDTFNEAARSFSPVNLSFKKGIL